MSEFVYNTRVTMIGPWLFDSQKLETLDSVLDKELERLSARKEDLIKKEVESTYESIYNDLRFKQIEGDISEETKISRLKLVEESVRRSSTYKDKRILTLFLKTGSKVKVASFREALRLPELLEAVPVGFEVEVERGDVSCNIDLSRFDGTLSIKVSPENLTETREMLTTLQRWASTSSAPKWQQIWRRLNGLQWLLWVLMFFISSWILTSQIEEKSKGLYKQQARQLLEGGISQDEQLKAVEVVLALQAEYVPPSTNTAAPLWWLIFIFGGLIICLILSFPPKAEIGIGKGLERINRWRVWLRVVFILVPAFLFTNTLGPYLYDLVSK